MDRNNLLRTAVQISGAGGNLLLLAPRDGLVTSRDAEPGSTVIAGQAVLRLVEPDSLWVKARLDQGRSRGLAVGQPADIVLRSNVSTPLPGKVARIEPVSDSVTEERIVQIAFEHIPAGLSVGEMTEVTVKTGAAQSGLLLSNAAIKQMPQGSGVWKLKDGKPSLTPVKLGSTSLDGNVQILDGLAAGDEVVIHSERELSEGARITRECIKRLHGSLLASSAADRCDLGVSQRVLLCALQARLQRWHSR